MAEDNNAALTLQELQDQVQVLQDAVAATAAAPPGGAPPAPPAATFALAPALAYNAAAYLDLSTTNGGKHFKTGTESLTTQAFNFEDPSDLRIFLDLIKVKSQVFGWNPILSIPVTDATTGVVTHRDLLDKYGMIERSDIIAHLNTYYSTPTKQAQDSFMFCQCLIASLSIDFLKKITAESKNYHLPAILAADGPVPCGPLLLKIIISKAHVDSRATVSYIRKSLCELDDMMLQLDSNVMKFNAYVKMQVATLSARGETTNDLLMNLFKAYKVADDADFKDFVKRKENEYEEGKDVDVDNLMEDAVAKYNARNLKKEWSAPTKEQDQILALTARVEQLTKSKAKQPSASTVAPVVSKKGKNPEWAWKDIKPKDGEPTTKDFKGKHYHWDACKFHSKRWTCHTTDKCSKNPDNEVTAASSVESPPAAATEEKKPSRRLKAAKLAAALLEDEDEETEDDDGSSG
jgi:hypothetical protein